MKEKILGIPLRKLLDCFFLLRIPLFVPVWTILFLGWITGSKNAHIGGVITTELSHLGDVWLVAIAFSLIVAPTFIVNQIVDIEGDRINGKLFLLPQGFLSIRTAWIIATFCAVAGLAIEFFFISNISLLIIFILGLLLGILYNLPPFELKNDAWGGTIANALGHGLLTFLAGWYAAKLYEPFNLNTLITGLISGLSPALANGAVYLATTIPDAAGDRTTNKRTFCVVYGEKTTAIASTALAAGAFIASFGMMRNWWVMATASSISLFFFGLFAVSTKREHAFMAFKWPVFLLAAFVALFSPEYGILTLVSFFGTKAYYKWRFDFDYPNLKSK